VRVGRGGGQRSRVIPGSKERLSQRLMELGALVCTPRAPRCEACPWRERCVARREGSVGRIPVVPAKAARPTVRWDTIVMQDARGLVLERRGESGLWAGLWQTPTIEHAVGDMTKIAGQKPVVTKARKAIAGFKIREGYPIGCMVTLRGARMYEFLDRLVTIAFPRVRDFRGVSGKAFDGRGNYNIGVKEQIIFPEIEYDKIDALRGMNISITTTAKTDDEAKALLAAFKFPFRN